MDLLARGQQQLLRRWLRYVESLRDTEEVVHVCEPEAGRNLSDDEEKRSLEDIRDCQVSSKELSSCQMGNEMGSLGDLIDYQVGREEIPYFQVGKGEKMSSKVSSYQQGELMEKDQTHFLIIGGIEVILPYIPVEVESCVTDATTTEGQPAVTIKEKEEMDQT
jgi:hypothetical protein